jgi:hypothetical protein
MSLFSKFLIVNLAAVLNKKRVVFVQDAGGITSALCADRKIVVKASDRAGLLANARLKLVRVESGILFA